ncbi:MBL fold metallo-hydrolase [Bacteroides sp. 41_26]|uniref:MBL fold metallo-hydrolase n=1 Tax=Bacteroides sp. 41_26 TaxID=1896973 RepID=UPI00259D177D|nr:MBL fold metallo-hydrolase [Bacteroides sp. 41_26]
MEIIYNSTSFYLEPCNGGFLLIDAGWRGQLSIFLNKLHLIGVKPQQIQYILLTHHHHDHTAIVSELKELTGARLILYKDQLVYLKKGVTNYKNLKQYNKLLWMIDRITRPFIKYQYPAISPNETDIIVNSDIDDYSLRNIGIKGKIIATPGHSHDSISVLLDNGNAYVGDLVMNMPNMKIIGKIPFPIEAEDYSQVQQSLRKLLGLGATVFFPSHGQPVSKKIIEDSIE